MRGMSGGAPGHSRLAAAAAVCAAGLAASACGSDTRAAETPARGAAATAESRATDQHARLPEPEPYPTWDAETRRAARRAAHTAMVRFARPDRSAAAWWSGLAPLLSAGAAVAYHGTDPANVPARRVTGGGELGARSSPYLARVRVPTDVGGYTVLLSRAGEDSPWLVERLTPPRALRSP